MGKRDDPLAERLHEILGPGFRKPTYFARGGMGRLYRTHDAYLQRDVIIKTHLLEGSTDRPSRNRLKREARVAAQIHHPNIVPVFFAGDDPARPPAGPLVYFGMRYIKGKNLEQLGTERPTDVATTITILHTIADALEAAHGINLIHRDIKPSNVMIEKDTGRIFVMDFGIALPQGQPRWTSTGYVIGTPDYMSPEQIAGDGLDARVDVYALGEVGYFLLTGEHPFTTAGLPRLQREKREWSAVVLEDAAPDAPAKLVEIIARCMAYDPEMRFPSAAAVREALRALLPRLTIFSLLEAFRSGGIDAAKWARFAAGAGMASHPYAEAVDEPLVFMLLEWLSALGFVAVPKVVEYIRGLEGTATETLRRFVDHCRVQTPLDVPYAAAVDAIRIAIGIDLRATLTCPHLLALNDQVGVQVDGFLRCGVLDTGSHDGLESTRR